MGKPDECPPYVDDSVENLVEYELGIALDGREEGPVGNDDADVRAVNGRVDPVPVYLLLPCLDDDDDRGILVVYKLA